MPPAFGTEKGQDHAVKGDTAYSADMSTRPGGPIAVLFGTRPEAIKLSPVILALRERGREPLVVSTGQHRELVDDVLGAFRIEIDEDLELMRPRQTLDYLLAEAVSRVGEVLDRHRPSAVVVQGDTTSMLGSALAGFHHEIPVAHVEAGLRSHDLRLPFPEEMNRRVAGIVARWHFAPTEHSARNLAAEGVTDGVLVTGNTVVDALAFLSRKTVSSPRALADFIERGPFILATAHRRESWGAPIRSIAAALAEVLAAEPQLRLVFATHPNPAARGPVTEVLGDEPRAAIVDALSYPVFIGLLNRSMLAVSDSGGVQEEGPSLGIPVLVTRSVTERPEGVEAGAVRLVGTDLAAVRDATLALVRDPEARTAMAGAGHGVYGDGHAAERIADVLIREVAP